MKTIAVITGASSGLGKEFVRQIVLRGAPNEIWIIARRKERLEEIAASFPCSIVPVALDLTDPASYDVLAGKLAEENPRISYLVCAAGMGRIGLTEDMTSDDIDRLIEFAKRAGGIDYAYETMKRLRDEANDVLSPFSPDDTVDQFREVFDYVIERRL